MSRLGEVLARLSATIAARRGADPQVSWSARLLADPSLAAKKLAEEAVETALALVQGDREAVAAESADLLFHWLVALEAAGVTHEDVAKALEAREGVGGLAEKAGRRA